MKIKAYILCADPAWLQQSVLSYYDVVSEIVLIADKNGLGWSGVSMPSRDCIKAALAVDRKKKMRVLEGDFSNPSGNLMACETRQRQVALDACSQDADWILQLDGDEILPNASEFVRYLENRVPEHCVGVNWPMRTFFQRTASGKFLEICGTFGGQIDGFPGCVAVRPGVKLTLARQVEGEVCTFVTHHPKRWYGLKKADSSNGVLIPASEAILHLSWVRSEAEVLQKVSSWGHARDFDVGKFVENVWKPAPKRWLFRRHFHPIWPAAWPALKPVALPMLRDVAPVDGTSVGLAEV
ncbi:MAG: hypothetical protein WCL08_07255 [Verrucomicrobiota bacterium]